MIVGAGVLTIFGCIGIGRFALGMLLPSMGEQLRLTYAEMGFISTGNFVGYLAAVFAAGGLDRRFGARRTIAAGLGVVGLSMVLVGSAGGFAGVLVLYILTGLGSGAANVPIMGLVSHWFGRRHRGRAAGWMVAGNGTAIILAGLSIPAINAAAGADGWRYGWFTLGATVLATAVVCAVLLRDRPAEVGLSPFGEGAPTAPAPHPARGAPASAGRTIAHLGAVYFLFGFTYVIYATFIVTSLVQDRGFTEAEAGRFWVAVGALSLVSGPVFGTLSDRIGRRGGLMTVFALQAAAYALVALPLPGAFLYLSIVLFGVCAWSVPSIMAAAVGDYLGADRAARAFGTVTMVFGAGQITGPAIAGLAAEATGSFAASFAIAAALAATAIGLAALLRPPAD